MAMDSWSKPTYHRRLFMWLLGYSLLLVGCFVVFQYHREKEFKIAEINSQLQLINTYIITELDEGRRPDEISLKEFGPFENVRLSVISDSGAMLYDNSLDSVSPANHLDRAEIKQALAGGTGYAVRRHSMTTGDNYFYSAQKGNGPYIVRTAIPYSISLMTLLRADFGFLWVMGAITLTMCLIGYFATRRLGHSIIRLNRFAESVERGEPISDTEPFPDDELGNISNHIVRLYVRLQQATADRDAEHRAAMFEQHEKERIKKQLTNNINHELKTPVASIQLCVETLMAHPELAEEKRDMFLQRCAANTQRLRRLLADVGLLTRMDDGSDAIDKEPTDLSVIVADAVAANEPAAEAKSIAIVNEIDRPLELQGNPSLLESVLNNLIDNAIAYSGGSLVRIALVAATPERISLTVADNGSGVPPQHLPRLFERFYRIDKGRSRAAGGTGLGLSIVRNAVAFHGGTITVENRASGGLVFKISLPCKS